MLDTLNHLPDAIWLLVFIIALAMAAAAYPFLHYASQWAVVAPELRRLHRFCYWNGACDEGLEAIMDARSWDELCANPRAEPWAHWVMVMHSGPRSWYRLDHIAEVRKLFGGYS